MLVENIHTKMNITEYVIQLNSSLGSEEVNKLTKYIKQAMWLKITEKCACGCICM